MLWYIPSTSQNMDCFVLLDFFLFYFCSLWSTLTLQISLCFGKFHFQYINSILHWRICFVMYGWRARSFEIGTTTVQCVLCGLILRRTTASFNVICVPYGFSRLRLHKIIVFSVGQHRNSLQRESTVQPNTTMQWPIWYFKWLFIAQIFVHLRLRSSERLERKLPCQLSMFGST